MIRQGLKNFEFALIAKQTRTGFIPVENSIIKKTRKIVQVLFFCLIKPDE